MSETILIPACRAALIPSQRHRCIYVKSIISPLLLRFHQSLSLRLDDVVSGASVTQHPIQNSFALTKEQASPAPVAAMMVLLAAASHVVRVLQNWDVLSDSVPINNDADVKEVMLEAQAMFANLRAAVENAACSLITAPFLAELPGKEPHFTTLSSLVPAMNDCSRRRHQFLHVISSYKCIFEYPVQSCCCCRRH
jgi:hypothetical protein